MLWFRNRIVLSQHLWYRLCRIDSTPEIYVTWRPQLTMSQQAHLQASIMLFMTCSTAKKWPPAFLFSCLLSRHILHHIKTNNSDWLSSSSSSSTMGNFHFVYGNNLPHIFHNNGSSLLGEPTYPLPPGASPPLSLAMSWPLCMASPLRVIHCHGLHLWKGLHALWMILCVYHGRSHGHGH